MSDDDAPEEEVEEGEAWLATFADLMSLLMCFFVLLLSFSEMDLEKYRQIAGSLRLAFGVQREVVAEEPPKGVSLIAQEFTPGKPEPTAMKVMKQQGNEKAQHRESVVEAVEVELQSMLAKLRETLGTEIEEGKVEVLRIDDEVVVRISEKESFPSGSAKLRRSFYPILDSIAQAVAETTGRLIVAGHTDDVPIATRIFPSNWVLSSTRAANVVHHFAKGELFDSQKIEIRAYADTRPLNENDTRENKANNRRVEVIVSHADILQSVRNSAEGGRDDDMVGPVQAAAMPMQGDEIRLEPLVGPAVDSTEEGPGAIIDPAAIVMPALPQSPLGVSGQVQSAQPTQNQPESTE